MSEITLSGKLTRKLYLVYLLNVVDWICTVLLISTGLFYEPNPIARTFIGSIFLGFLFKCVVPFIVVFFSARYMYILGFKELRFADMLISFTLTVYLFITLDHLVNFILYSFI